MLGTSIGICGDPGIPEVRPFHTIDGSVVDVIRWELRLRGCRVADLGPTSPPFDPAREFDQHLVDPGGVLRPPSLE